MEKEFIEQLKDSGFGLAINQAVIKTFRNNINTFEKLGKMLGDLSKIGIDTKGIDEDISIMREAAERIMDKMIGLLEDAKPETENKV